MKRFLTIMVPAWFLAGAMLGTPAPLAAAQAIFSKPVPVGSAAPGQTFGKPPTHTDATVVKFFDHPLASGQKNFGTFQGTVTIDGKAYRVSDIVATPGLLPREEVPVKKAAEMIVVTDKNLLGEPFHAVCPEAAYFKLGGTFKAGMSFQCTLWGTAGDPPVNVEQNYTDRQLEAGDIRNAVPPDSNDEFVKLFGGNPLEDFLIGDARETTKPYAPAIYPAFVDSDARGEEGFQPIWMKKFDGATGYNEVFAYDVAPVYSGAVGNDGLMTAPVYDSLDLGVAMTATVAAELTPTLIAQQIIGIKSYGDYVEKLTCPTADPDCIDDEDKISMPFNSPAAFFRRDFQEGRLRFAGYTSFVQVPKDSSGYSFELDDSVSPPVLKPLGSAIDRAAAVQGQHFNPIAVVAMRYPRGIMGFMGGPNPDGFAVVNQATMLNLDDLAFEKGMPKVINGVAQRWRDIFRMKKADGTYEKLTKERMPNRVISTAVFWGRSIDAETGEAARWGNPQGVPGNVKDPNFIYNPFILGITGPGMYDAAAMVDRLSNKDARQMLVIPAGEADESGKYYVYKIDPVSGEKIWWVEDGKPLVQKETAFVAPDFYEVDVPAGFAPYQVAVAEVWDDTDGIDNAHSCDDILLTFRGGAVMALGSGFKNDPGQTVVFRAGKEDPRMFSPEVRAYRGVLKDGKCTIDNTDSEEYRRVFMPAADAQVAAIAVANFNGDKGYDLLAGDLVPREIVNVPGAPADPQAGQVTGFATLYPEFQNSPLGVQKVRVGFAATNTKPPLKVPNDPSSGIDPQYLIDVIATPDHTGLLGVGALDGDRLVPAGANVAAINGAPLMLPPFGCSEPDGVDVVSPYEVTAAALQKLPNPNLPQRCQNIEVCVAGNGQELPTYVGGPCCNPCEDPVKSTPENECTLLCWNDASNPYYNKTLCEYYFEGENAQCHVDIGIVNPCANGGCTFPPLDDGSNGGSDDGSIDIGGWSPIDPFDNEGGVTLPPVCSEKLKPFGDPSKFAGTACCADACSLGCMLPCAQDSYGYHTYTHDCWMEKNYGDMDNDGKLNWEDPDWPGCLPRNDEYQLQNDLGKFAPLCGPSDKYSPFFKGGVCHLCSNIKNDCGAKDESGKSAVRRFRDKCIKNGEFKFVDGDSSDDAILCRYWRDMCEIVNSNGSTDNYLLDLAKGSLCQARNDTDDGDSSNDTSFASAWRPDVVVTPPRDGIVSAAAIEPAAFQPGTLPDGQIGIIPIKPKAPRFPRGQAMPGPREMTVVVNKGLAVDPCYTADTIVVPFQCNDAGGCNTAAGETCNPLSCICEAGPIIDDPEPVNPCYNTHGTLPPNWECNADVGCPGTQECVQNSSDNCVCMGGTPADACSTSTAVPPPAPWDCNAAVSCPTGQICALVGTNCNCVTPDIPPDGLQANDCTCTVTGDPSENFQKERQRLNSEFAAGPSGKGNYDLFVASESRITCLCYIPGAAAGASSSSLLSGSAAAEVLPSATIQMGGQFFKNFLQPGPFKRETVTEKVQILPGPGGQGAGKGMTADLSASASLSGVTPMANVVSTNYTSGSSSVAGGSSVDINGVLRREIFPVTAGGNFSISAGGMQVNLPAPVDGAYVRYDFITMPWCPLFTGADGYDENCAVGGFPTQDSLKAVKAELEKRKAAGVKTSEIFVGLPWPQTFNYQFKHVQAKSDGDVAEPQFAFLAADFIGARGGGCGCVLGGMPPEMPALLFIIVASAAVMGGLVLVRVRSRRK